MKKGCKKHRPGILCLIRGAYFGEKKTRSLNLQGFGQDFLALLSFTGQQYLKANENYQAVNKKYLGERIIILRDKFHAYAVCAQ